MPAHDRVFFLDAADRFTDTVATTTDWSATTPCEDWTAADVVDHVVDAERDFLGRHGVDLGERPSGEPADVWAAHLAAVRPVVEDAAFLAREFDGFFGRTTIGTTLDDFYAFDLVVHGWDLGSSNGRPTTFTDDEMDTMDAAIEGFGEHAYDEGVFQAAGPRPEGRRPTDQDAGPDGAAGVAVGTATWGASGCRRRRGSPRRSCSCW